MPTADVIAAGAALDTLIHQFSDPFSFYRELIQNALDADTIRVDVDVAWDEASGTLSVTVEDSGEGMTAEIIDTKLTRLFSSGKEGDLTRIGKFGIGFVSVFAVDPERVVVETARGGEAWRVVFARDRSFVRTRLAEPREGTRVQLFKAATRAEADAFILRSREVLTFWCKHVQGEIRFRGEAVNQPFDVDAPCRVRWEEPGTTIVVGYPASLEPFIGFYNRGLTLLESREAHTFPNVSVKADSRYLEHTLTRDNIVQDEHFAKVVSRIEALLQGALPDRLLADLEAAILTGQDADPLHRAATRLYGWTWERTWTPGEMSHRSGAPEGEDWVVEPRRHATGHVTFGPYTREIPAGYACTARFLLRVPADRHVAGDTPVAVLDVHDGDRGRRHVHRAIRWRDFPVPGALQEFALPFVARAGERVEFRTDWSGLVPLAQRCVRVTGSPRRLRRESDPARLARAVLSTPGGRPVTMAQCHEAARRRRLYTAPQPCPLVEALEARCDLVLRAGPGSAAWAFCEALLNAPPQAAAEAFVLPRLCAEDEASGWEPLRAALLRLAPAWGGRLRDVRLAHLDDPACPAISQKDLGAIERRRDALRAPRGLFSPARTLVVNVDHPTVARLIVLAAREAEVAAWLLVKRFLQRDGLDAELDAKLALRAWEQRSRRA